MATLPSLDEILLALLEHLQDGEPHLKIEVVIALALRFDVELEPTLLTNHSLFANLIDRCHADCVYGGFTEDNKPEKPRKLKITPLGLDELLHRKHLITVAYVRAFGDSLS